MELLTVNSGALQAVRRRLSCSVLRRHQLVFHGLSDLHCFLSSAQDSRLHPVTADRIGDRIQPPLLSLLYVGGAFGNALARRAAQ